MARVSIDGFAGVLVLPGDADYDGRRTLWNAIIDRRPAVIARCTSAADVAAAVRFGRDRGLTIGVRCGGHGILGLAVPQDGLVIDLTPMGDVRVDPDARRAYVGGGAMLGGMDRASVPHGLATTAGEISHTGVGGLTLGGGFGWLARQVGMSCDNVETYTVVTADGEILRASATEHPDLYWGLRGGGGNFGVVTEFVFRLHPFSGRALTVDLDFDAAEGLAPMRRWRDLLSDAPREATLTSSVGSNEDGRPILSLGFCWVGDPEQGRAYLRTLRSIGTPESEDIRELGYVELQQQFDTVLGPGKRRYSTSHYLPELSDAAIEAYLGRGVPGGDVRAAGGLVPKGGLELHGGAILDIADEEAAYSGRDALVEWAGSGVWTDPAEDHERIANARRYGAAMAPFARGVYINNLDEPGEAGVKRAFRPDKLARLREVKRRYDPENVFRANQNIAPA